MKIVTLISTMMCIMVCKTYADCVSFESWTFEQGKNAIVAAAAEMAEGVSFALYAGYRIGSAPPVHKGPVPATYTYRVQEKNGEWGELTSKKAEAEAYELTAWPDGNYAGEWDRTDEGKQMILNHGQNPPVQKQIWYKFIYNTAGVMKQYKHVHDQSTNRPIQSLSAQPLVWKTESFVSEPPKGTAPGTRRCMPRSASSYLYQIVMCVSTNVSGTNTLAWAHMYDLPYDPPKE